MEGMFCLAPFAEDGLFYRAKVVGMEVVEETNEVSTTPLLTPTQSSHHPPHHPHTLHTYTHHPPHLTPPSHHTHSHHTTHTHTHTQTL